MLAPFSSADTTLALGACASILGVIMSAIRKIAIAVFLLFSSAAIAQPASPSPKPGGKSICVASALGQRYDVQTVGLMVFGNSLESVSVESWGVDDMVARKIGVILGNRFSVRRINFPKGGISDASGALFNNQDAAQFAALRGAAGTTKCDFFLVVTKGGSQFMGTNQSVVGLGVVKHDGGILVNHYLFAYISLRLFDNATMTVKRPQVDLGGLLLGNKSALRNTDRANWPATPQAAVQSPVLRDAALTMVAQSLAEKVPKLFE
jgi:hypothetical protein